MKKLVLIMVLIASSLIVGAANDKENESVNKKNAKVNTTQTVSGQIVDKKTGEPLAGVKVTVIGSKQEVYTDFDGRFSLEASSSRACNLKTDYLSYKTSVHQNLVFKNIGELKISLSTVE